MYSNRIGFNDRKMIDFSKCMTFRIINFPFLAIKIHAKAKRNKRKIILRYHYSESYWLYIVNC